MYYVKLAKCRNLISLILNKKLKKSFFFTRIHFQNNQVSLSLSKVCNTSTNFDMDTYIVQGGSVPKTENTFGNWKVITACCKVELVSCMTRDGIVCDFLCQQRNNHASSAESVAEFLSLRSAESSVQCTTLFAHGSWQKKPHDFSALIIAAIPDKPLCWALKWRLKRYLVTV
jgi:hypothetical protein